MEKRAEVDHHIDDEFFATDTDIRAAKPRNPDSWFQKRLDQVRSQQQSRIRSKLHSLKIRGKNGGAHS